MITNGFRYARCHDCKQIANSRSLLSECVSGCGCGSGEAVEVDCHMTKNREQCVQSPGQVQATTDEIPAQTCTSLGSDIDCSRPASSDNNNNCHH